MKLAEGRVPREQNSRLPAKKKEIVSGKNISKFCSEILLKSPTNLYKELLMINKTTNLDSLQKKKKKK